MQRFQNDFYIVGIESVFPKFYDSCEVTGKLYGEHLASEKIHKLAKRLCKNVHIDHRAISIDLNRFPDKIVSTENSPVSWATRLHQQLFAKNAETSVDFFSLSYNTSSHTTPIPNLACQIANACHMQLRHPPQEISNYGCASGIFSIVSAIDFCGTEDSLAFIVAFEQSSWLFQPIYDEHNPDFKASLRTHAIFGDGGGGLLIASGSKADTFDKKLKIIDIEVAYEYGNVISMTDGYFLTREGVKDLMPELVSTKVIKPLLERNGLSVQDIKAWSIHQGGVPVLEAFTDKDILGLTDEQIDLSKQMFVRNGNISTPSNLIVFEQQFKRDDMQEGDYGMIVGFGAGYYLGAVLYRHA